MAGYSRIQQGEDGGERLFTVRPRSSSAVNEKRGTVSSIRFHIPEDLKGNEEATNAFINNIPSWTGKSSAGTAFAKAVDTGGMGFINFIAQSVSYNIQEKSQVVHTFGGQEAVYFYGRAPVNVNFSGLIVDDLDNDQFAQFLGLYSQFLRGTKASQDYCYVELSLNNITFFGSFTGISIQQASDRDTDVTFSAQFLAKNFVIASTDSIFTENNVLNQPVVIVRDDDITLTAEAIQDIISQNATAHLTPLEDGSPSANTVPGTSLGFGDYRRSFGSLPTVSDLFGFSAADITGFFGDTSDILSIGLNPIVDAANYVSTLAGEMLGMVESVEQGINGIIDDLQTATSQVYGAIDNVDDVISKVVNFPESMTSKLGSIGLGPSGGAPSIGGSENISASSAFSILIPASNVGAARGTPEGDAAKLAVSTSANLDASLTPNSGESGTGIPSITLGSPLTITRVGG